MIIKNFENLARSELRRHLLKIAEAGYASINTKEATVRFVKYDKKKNILEVQKQKFELNKFKRVFVLAFGKAALESATVLKSILGEKVYRGVVIDVVDLQQDTTSPWPSPQQERENWIYRQATHPNVSKQNVDAAKQALSILTDLKADDLVICSISGGGSAIFELPYEVEIEKAAGIFKAMTKGGATISELNCVRKHTSLVKGGQLAKHFYPATIVSLIFSDVPGDDLSVIASGPLVKDPTTSRDAQSLLEKFNVLSEANLSKLELIETPKEDKYFEKVNNFLIVSPKMVMVALKEKAEELGWPVKIYGDKFQGIARDLGPQIVAQNKKGECLIGAGESTAKIIGKGKGGRNQEMELAPLSALSENQAFGCFASDGHDFTDAAGAIVDSSTLLRSKSLNLKFEIYLNNNDSFNFFEQTDDLVLTGLTGSNAADFFVLLSK